MRRVHLAAGIARYVWAAPCTAVGLCLVAPAFLFGAPPGWLTVLLKSHFPRSNRPTFSLERCPLTRSRSVTSYSQAAKQNSTACEHMSRHPRQAIRKVASILLRGIPRCEPRAVAELSPSVHRQLLRMPGA